ncbi:MAG: hypothetical protein U0524_02500 [Candidatus Saccharimonadales bacterium]
MSASRAENLSYIDIQFGKFDGACNYGSINENCGQAIESGIQDSNCADSVNSAEVEVTCPGKIMGICQAELNVALYDQSGNPLGEVKTSAAELQVRALVNEVFESSIEE